MMRIASMVLPFRTNHYYLELVQDWRRPWNDPIARFVLPHPDMLPPHQLERLERLLEKPGVSQKQIAFAINMLRYELNPHPDGQVDYNIPKLNDRALTGLQHKYRETLLIFPSWGQQCGTYCGYCFRWAQFVDIDKFEVRPEELADALAYVTSHPEITDVLFTGGDPLFARTNRIREYVKPFLELDHIKTIRFGTKMPVHWPFRFLPTKAEGNADGSQRKDAEDLLALFETICRSGKHLAVMLHSSHPIEFSTKPAQAAIARILNTGAVIRTQSPVVRYVNDAPELWAQKWRLEVNMGMIPYYMFVERDTGAQHYWEIPLKRVYEIFCKAFRRVSGLARTVRGPSMSTTPGKVRILGIRTINKEKVFVLDLLQGRNPDWVGRPFFAAYDAEATWFDQLSPAFGESEFFFQKDLPIESRQESSSPVRAALADESSWPN
jgi:L-lysine 2,3-aminomutase